MAKKIGPGKSNLNDNLKDSIYEKDIWLEESDSTNWDDGNVSDLMNNLYTVITNSTTDNPKTILVHLKRTTPLLAIGLGAFTGNFSNVKLIGVTSGNVEVVLFDDSANNTKKTTLTIFTPTVGLNAIKIQFFTVDTVSLSNLYVPRALTGVVRIQGQKPDNNFVEFQATNDGNFKISLEEFENLISVNNNSQLKTTTFDSNGNEGQKIIGIDYLPGNSGIDKITETLQQISYEHHEIHSGNHYHICDYALNQASDAVIEFILNIPDTTKWPHMTFSFSGSEGATLEVYKNPTTIVGGTIVVPLNNDHNSANVSNITIIKNPTSIGNDGIRLDGHIAGGDRTAGFTMRENENILKQNTVYLFRITSLAVSNDIGFCGEWYEHINKN